MQCQHEIGTIRVSSLGRGGADRRTGAPMEVVAAVVLTILFAGALAVIFGLTALRNARTH